MSQTEDPLFCNEAFYLAFTQKELSAMELLWAQDWPLICVHPGWPLLNNRDEIMDSWRRILSNPNQAGMDFHQPVLHQYPGCFLVTCYEQLQGAVCVATNGFVQEKGTLKMYLHHSSMCAHPPEGV